MPIVSHQRWQRIAARSCGSILSGLFRRPHACLLLLLAALIIAACNGSEAWDEKTAQESAHALSIEYSDVTAEVGLEEFVHENGAVGKYWMPETFGGGGGFIDFDGDGWQDIILVAGGTWSDEGEPVPALELFRNQGDGTFVRVTERVNLGNQSAYGFGIAVGDYDNDGDDDVFLGTTGRDMLFRNEDGRFIEVGEIAGVSERADWSTSAIFFDADNDGFLDLYVGGYVVWSPETDILCTLDGETKTYCTPREYPGIHGRFYHNNGDGTFTDRTEAAGFGDSPGKTLAVAEMDFNNDGYADIVVANDTERDLLYRNNGDGTFTEIGVIAGIAYDANGRARAGMGLDVGVVDTSGEPTVFVGNYSNEMVGVYKHVGNGIFTDRAASSRIGQPSLMPLTFGLMLLDVDLDGDEDLFIANGHIRHDIEKVQQAITWKQYAQLFVNRGNGTFDEALEIQGDAFQQRLVGRGAAHADYDRDGDLDVLVVENAGPARLWRNELNPSLHTNRNYLRVQLVGTESNRNGYGARLHVVTGSERQQRRIRSGRSYLSHSEAIATFGLGDATIVDTLRIEWPSGAAEVFTSINANQVIKIVEGSGKVEPISPNRLAVAH